MATYSKIGFDNPFITKAIASKLKKLPHPLSKSDAVNIGKEMVAEMKALIAVGSSPIRGYGKFPKYKNPKTGYPSTVAKQYPNKKASPVNLYLSGDFLKDLKAEVVKIRQSFAIAIGYSKEKEILKEKGHREGANTQPNRPTLPLARANEQFALRVQEKLLRRINEILGKIIKG